VKSSLFHYGLQKKFLEDFLFSCRNLPQRREILPQNTEQKQLLCFTVTWTGLIPQKLKKLFTVKSRHV